MRTPDRKPSPKGDGGCHCVEEFACDTCNNVVSTKLKVWLAQVNYQYGASLFLPYSAGCLEAYARSQEDIDEAFEFCGYLVRRDPIAAVVEKIERAGGIDVLGLSVYTWNAHYSGALAAAIRQRWPECLIVAGGPEISADRPRDTLWDAIDIAVIGEGELVFSDILRRFLHVKDTVHRNVDWSQLFSDASLSDFLYGRYESGKQPVVIRANRIKDLSILPSPYLTGCFDRLLADRHTDSDTGLASEIDWQATFEGGPRGCPYASYAGETYIALPDRLFRFDEQHYGGSIDIVCQVPDHIHAIGLHDERIMRQAVKPCITIRLLNGLSLTVTPDHTVHRVNVEHESIEQCRADALNVGDFIPIEVGQNAISDYIKLIPPSMDIYPRGIGRRRPEEVSLPEILDEDLAWLMGYIIGDGCLSNDRRYPSGFRTTVDLAVHCSLAAEVKERVKRIFGEDLLHFNRSVLTDKMVHGVIYRRMVVRFFRETLGMDGGDEKLRVPRVIFESPASVVRSFLHGLYAADGYQGKYGQPYLTTVSRRLAEEVAHCIHWIGDAAVVRGPIPHRGNPENGQPYYRIEWHDQSCFSRLIGQPCLASRIPFPCAIYRSRKSGKLFRRTRKSLRQRGVSRNLLKELDPNHPLVTSRFVYAKVISIENAGLLQTYDVHHHPSHTVSANGVFTRQCNFCSWSMEYYAKLYSFPLERVLGELQWMGEHKIRYTYASDANWGIVERDLDVTRALVETKRLYGFPKEARFCTAKGSNDRVFEITKLLHEAGMCKGATLSLQSLDPETLKIAKRKNMKINDFAERLAAYNKAGIATYTELILGLPGETKTSFEAGLNQLLDAGKHEGLNIYLLQVLPNTDLADPAYREQHGIQTVRGPMLLQHSTPADDPHAEQQDIVVQTATMSAEDWAHCYMLAWAVQTFHAMGLTRYIAILCRHQLGLPYTEFYHRLMDWAYQHSEKTLLGEEYLIATEVMRRGGRGGDWGSVDYRFGSIVWPSEEISFLRLASQHERLYAEVASFLSSLLTRHVDFMGFTSLLDGVLAYQQAMLVRPDDGDPRYLDLPYNLHQYFTALLRGEPVTMEYRPESLIILPEQRFSSLEDYARRITWHGRKGGRFTQRRVVLYSKENEYAH